MLSRKAGRVSSEEVERLWKQGRGKAKSKGGVPAAGTPGIGLTEIDMVERTVMPVRLQKNCVPHVRKSIYDSVLEGQYDYKTLSQLLESTLMQEDHGEYDMKTFADFMKRVAVGELMFDSCR